MTPSLSEISTNLTIPNIADFEFVALAVYPLTFIPPFTRITEHFEKSNVTVVFGYGDLEVPSPIRVGPVGIDKDGNLTSRVKSSEDLVSFDNHSYALFYAPFKINEPEPWDKIRSCVSMLSLLEQNRTFQPVFLRFIFDQKTFTCSQLGPESPVPSQPIFFKTPESALDALKPFIGSDLQAESLNRALEWFYRSLEAGDDAFRFLGAWIACETLTESSDTDISKIVKMLHSHLSTVDGYQAKNIQETTQHLLLGRLHGVRGRLAHRGIVKGISPLLGLYVQILFAEMTFAYFKQESPGIALSFLESKRNDLTSDIKFSESASR